MKKRKTQSTEISGGMGGRAMSLGNSWREGGGVYLQMPLNGNSWGEGVTKKFLPWWG